LKGEYEARIALKEAFGFHTLWSGAPRLAERCILESIEGVIDDKEELVKVDVDLSPNMQVYFDMVYQEQLF
jgi:hypothetical protein